MNIHWIRKEKKFKNCEVHAKKSGHKISRIQRKSILIAALVTAVILALAFYVTLFPINPQAPVFWGAVIGGMFLFLAVKAISYFALSMGRPQEAGSDSAYQNYRNMKQFMIPVLVIAGLVVAAALGSTLFHAGKYASIMKVEDSVFEEDLAETLNTDSIALMDTYSAQMLGDREIGSLSNVVSQYNVASDYAQIDAKGAPMKVAALEYAGFFKWINNRSKGVPGYVTVNPVSMSADYNESSQGMIYVPSAYLGQDLARHIRMRYPFAMFENLHFEIDEEGNPYYVATVYKKTVMLFGGKTAKGAIIVDPTDGSSNYYDIKYRSFYS